MLSTGYTATTAEWNNSVNGFRRILSLVGVGSLLMAKAVTSGVFRVLKHSPARNII